MDLRCMKRKDHAVMKTRDRELSDFLHGGRYPGNHPTECKRALMRKLQMLKAARGLNDLKTPPANRLEPLKGDLKDRYSIRVSRQWRPILQWDATTKETVDVHFDDHHQ